MSVPVTILRLGGWQIRSVAERGGRGSDAKPSHAVLTREERRRGAASYCTGLTGTWDLPFQVAFRQCGESKQGSVLFFNVIVRKHP